jgi:hypothetical protein
MILTGAVTSNSGGNTLVKTGYGAKLFIECVPVVYFLGDKAFWA